MKTASTSIFISVSPEGSVSHHLGIERRGIGAERMRQTRSGHSREPFRDPQPHRPVSRWTELAFSHCTSSSLTAAKLPACPRCRGCGPDVVTDRVEDQAVLVSRRPCSFCWSVNHRPTCLRNVSADAAAADEHLGLRRKLRSRTRFARGRWCRLDVRAKPRIIRSSSLSRLRFSRKQSVFID